MITTPNVPDDLAPDDIVDIVIRHARVDMLGAIDATGVLTCCLPGVNRQLVIPTRDDNGQPMPYQVTVTRAKTCRKCKRVIPLSESLAGFTTCEHCPSKPAINPDVPIDYFPVASLVPDDCGKSGCATDHARLIPLSDTGDDDLGNAPGLVKTCYWREGGYYTCNALSVPGYIFCDRHVSLASLSDVQ